MATRPEPGDYFRRHINDMTVYGLTIYGYAMTKEETLEADRALGADEEELSFLARSFDRWLTKGLLWSKCYSVVVPDGEWGTTPAAAASKISKDEFERARDAGWNPR